MEYNKEQLESLINVIKGETNSSRKFLLNKTKAEILEQIKPSTKERIIFFYEDHIAHLKNGAYYTDENIDAPVMIEKRSLLEYNVGQRHPIPYCVIRYNKEYFMALRENGGEMRLDGKKGFLGGHVGEDDLCYKNDKIDFISTMRKGMLRELGEEAGITEGMINSIEYKGIIKFEKNNLETVEEDHLGFVYLIEVNTKDIQTLENELKGVWIHEDDFINHYDSLETWAKVVFHYYNRNYIESN